jgi:hypothetical protein
MSICRVHFIFHSFSFITKKMYNTYILKSEMMNWQLYENIFPFIFKWEEQKKRMYRLDLNVYDSPKDTEKREKMLLGEKNGKILSEFEFHYSQCCIVLFACCCDQWKYTYFMCYVFLTLILFCIIRV